ncbi:MAG: hypothetical protein KKC43_02880 [Alphaproteobacteria bacterium]|nr:hypothetical protein [Alphaproteobacteria bacterium]
MTVAMEHQAARTVSAREIGCFLLLFVVLLGPALINAFPLVMEDSIAYSGQGPHWMRGKSAAVLVALPYRLAGYWALPLINCAMNAAAWILLVRIFSIRPNPFLVLLLACVSLQPLYASAVLVDAWFFPAVVLLLSAGRLPPVFVGALAGLLLSSHGSGHVMACVFAILAAGLCRSHRLVLAALVAAIIAFGFNLLLDSAYATNQPRLAKTFPAARAFSVQPELLAREAERSGDPMMAEAAGILRELEKDPALSARRDLFWDIWKQTEGRFDLAKFEQEHAGSIIRDAFVYRPFGLLLSIGKDYTSFYGPDTRLDFQPVLSEPFPSGFDASLQAEGFFMGPAVRHVATALRYACYLTFLVSLWFGWRVAPASLRKVIAGAVLLLIANDAMFAILSGPPDRYHHRALPLLAAAALLLLSQRRAIKPL